LGRQPEAALVAFLEGGSALILHMALHGTDPALGRADHGDRLALDQNLEGLLRNDRRIGNAGPALPKRRLRAELLFQLLDLPRNRLPAQAFVAEQLLQLGLLL